MVVVLVSSILFYVDSVEDSVSSVWVGVGRVVLKLLKICWKVGMIYIIKVVEIVSVNRMMVVGYVSVVCSLCYCVLVCL